MTVSLLFYSNYCQHCKQIVNEINKTPLRTSIRYVCIDTQAVRAKLPEYISSVPALVVGETNQIYIGNQILGWLQMVPLIKKSNNNPQKAPASVQNIPTKKENSGPGEPNAWHTNEMNAFSDMYSFIDADTSAEGNGGLTMVHNFETLSGNGANIPPGVLNAPGGAPSRSSMPIQYGNAVSNPSDVSSYGSIQVSAKSEELNKSMEEMMSRRELDVPNVPRRL
tara:strand:- start:737 stop:1405 length:669 start_codon:yes stop_codon:yes gene_type:complete